MMPPLTIGAGYCGKNEFMEGIIDEVYIYNRALSAAEIKEYYERTKIIIKAIVDIHPDTLNFNSRGKWITGYIELPIGYEVKNIIIPSILLNQKVKAEVKPSEIGDYDNDGIADLMVKFDRVEVEKVVTVGNQVEIILTGELIERIKFKGRDRIRVITH